MPLYLSVRVIVEDIEAWSKRQYRCSTGAMFIVQTLLAESRKALSRTLHVDFQGDKLSSSLSDVLSRSPGSTTRSNTTIWARLPMKGPIAPRRRSVARRLRVCQRHAKARKIPNGKDSERMSHWHVQCAIPVGRTARAAFCLGQFGASAACATLCWTLVNSFLSLGSAKRVRLTIHGGNF